MKDARHWHGLMDVLIRRADEDDRMLNNNVPQELIQTSNHNSIADELIKLSDLKNKVSFPMMNLISKNKSYYQTDIN